jgi:hypothetical protein
MLKHKLFMPLTIVFLTAGIVVTSLFLSPQEASAKPVKGCQWVVNLGGTAYNICQEVSYATNCRPAQ